MYCNVKEIANLIKEENPTNKTLFIHSFFTNLKNHPTQKHKKTDAPQPLIILFCKSLLIGFLTLNYFLLKILSQL